MKKIIYSMMMIALTAFMFVSCEYVPAPYDVPETPHGEEPEKPIEPAGDGSVANPFNVAAAHQLIESLGADVLSQDVYVKGKISSIDNIDTGNFGNATYYISDTGSTSNQLEVFRGYSLGGEKFKVADEIKVGDEVVVVGKVVNFKGNTHEFTTGSKIYSLNGKTATEEKPTEFIGTIDDPITIAKALEVINGLEDNATTATAAYVKGKVTKVLSSQDNVTKYKNMNYIIADETGEIQVYAGKNLDNKEFTSVDQLKVGDEVIVLGKLMKFVKDGKVTPEIAKGNYIVKLTSGSGGNAGGDNVQGITTEVTVSTLGLKDKANVTSVNLADGTTLTCSKEDGATAPTYYAGGGGAIRFYAKNSLLLDAGNKKIIQVLITTTDPYQSNKYNGNDLMYAMAGDSKLIPSRKGDTQVTFANFNSSTLKIVNDFSDVKGGTQLRVLKLKITYAE